jgi:hypothetical protein
MQLLLQVVPIYFNPDKDWQSAEARTQAQCSLDKTSPNLEGSLSPARPIMLRICSLNNNTRPLHSVLYNFLLSASEKSR